MEILLREFRFGLRGLTKSRGFTAVAVLTLALGVGASTAIFSVVDAVLLRALPYPDSGKIVRVWEQAPNGHRLSLADANFEDFRSQNHTFAYLAEYVWFLSAVSGGSEPVQVPIAQVTGGFFESLGIAPLRGRTFAPKEPAALVSYRYWRRYLGGAPDLSQLRVKTEGAVYPVVGVMPEAFDFPAGVAVWIPRTSAPGSSRSGHNWRAVGRVRDGVTVAQAHADLGTIARQIRAQYGTMVDLNDAAVVPLANSLVGDVRTALLTLLSAVGLLLLVACANVAGLLVARTSARRKELALRTALGAGRSRLVLQFLAESCSLSAAAGLVGVWIAAAAVQGLRAMLPANLPRQEGVAVNGSVLLFALGVSAAVAVSLGLLAAWRAGRGDLQEALSSGGRGSGASTGRRLRSLVVICEIAATLVILVGAGLLGRSFLRLTATDPGFHAGNLVTMEFPVVSHQWQGTDSSALARQAQSMDKLLTRLRTIPGVTEAGLASGMPVAAGDDLPEGDFVILNGQKPPADGKEFGRMVRNRAQAGHALYCVAGEAYFRTMGISLIRGRMFDERDGWNAPHAAVISESLAHRRWPDRDPIGQTIDFGNMDGDLRPLTIVGIVGDVRAQGLDAPPSPVIYVNYRQRGLHASASPTILIRSAAPLGEIVPAARAIFHDLEPDLPAKFSTFADEMGGWFADRRFLLLLVGFFATAALGLAAVGIYGIVAFSVARRTQEIGIRVALGAQPGDVLRLVVSEGARLAMLGVAIGIAASLAISRLLSSLLFGVSATDPLTFAGVAALLSSAALLASYIPARRAMRLDPNDALRHE
jgi:predicted permease